MVKNDVCLGGESKQSTFLQKKDVPKNASKPPSELIISKLIKT